LPCKGGLKHVSITIVFWIYVWTTGCQAFDTHANGL
jgi:hypothetical protein